MARHVLIIEDEILIALELEAMLGDLGFESFDVADNAVDALEMARRHRPDLITADFHIVGGTGVEALSDLTAALGICPAIFVTANSAQLHGRAEPVVEKPVQRRRLQEACSHLGFARPAA